MADSKISALPAAVSLSTTDDVPVVQAGSTKKSSLSLLPVSTLVQAALKTVPSSVKTASYTLVLADAGTLVRMNVAGANTLTVPPNTSVAFPTDTVIMVHQYGSGITTITAGAGVTLRSRGGLLAINGQYANASIHKIAANEWLVAGDLA